MYLSIAYGTIEDRISNLVILDDASYFDHTGYNDANMNTNGERHVLSILKPNDVVFDVGANMGNWSLPIISANPAVSIYCFEPMPNVYSQLQANLKNKNVFTHQVALSDVEGISEFYYYPEIDELSTLHRRNLEIERLIKISPVIIKVSTQRLDSFCEINSVGHIDFLKIDTEGNELNVLRGSEKLFRKQAIDFVQFEYGGCYLDSKTTLKQVYHYLTSFGFVLHRITPFGLIRINAWRDELENFQYCNYFAIRLFNR